MSEMVERVARAIANEWANQNRLMFERHQHTIDAPALARAAIAAMREPTEKMINAGRAEDSSSWSLEPGEGRDYDPTAEMWGAMIDEALKD